MTYVDLAHTATDFNLTGHFMGQLRTANKRHKRAIVAVETRKKSAAALLVAGGKLAETVG